MASFLGAVASAPDLDLGALSPSTVGSYVDVRTYGVIGDGVVNDTAALQLAFDTVPAGKGLRIPAGLRLRITAPSFIGSSAVTVSRPNMQLVGAAPLAFQAGPASPNGSVIFVDDVGFDAGDGVKRVSSFCAIDVRARGFVLKDVYIYGRNNPWQGIVNSVIFQNGAVNLQASDALVSGCTFRYIYGFALHNTIPSARQSIINNQFLDLANGVNIADCTDTIQWGNRFERCNGIEAGATRCLVAYNTFIDCYGIAIGGVTIPPAEKGAICKFNTLIRPSAGSGITFNNVEDGECTDNVITASRGHGIAVVSSFGSISRLLKILRNTVVTAGGSPGGAHGLFFGGGGADSTLENNSFLSATNSGCQVQDTNGIHAAGNTFSGVTGDLSLIAISATFAFYQHLNSLAHANLNISNNFGFVATSINY